MGTAVSYTSRLFKVPSIISRTFLVLGSGLLWPHGWTRTGWFTEFVLSNCWSGEDTVVVFRPFWNVFFWD